MLLSPSLPSSLAKPSCVVGAIRVAEEERGETFANFMHDRVSRQKSLSKIKVTSSILFYTTTYFMEQLFA